MVVPPPAHPTSTTMSLHSQSQLHSLSLSINACASPRTTPSPTSPTSDHGTMSPFMSATEEKRALAEAEMQADLDRHRAAAAASDNGSGDEEHSRLKVLATVSFYLVAATVMVLANKWVLKAAPLPLTFLLAQLLIAVLLLHVSSSLGYFSLPPNPLSMQVLSATGPLIAVNIVGLGFNTYCLQYVDASFYQVARGLVLPFTVLASWAFLSGGRPSAGVTLSIFVVCTGFFSTVGAEHLTVSPVGVVLGVFSSLTTAVHAVVVKRSLSLSTIAFSPLDLAYYSNFLSALFLLPGLLLLTSEPVGFLTLVEEGGQPLQTFVLGACLTGLFGFLICIAGFLSIKVTSPVTHMVSSAVRGVLQTILGVWIFGDIVGVGRVIGIGLIVAGSLIYTWIKDREAVRTAREKRERREKEALAGLLSLSSISSGSGSASSSPYPSPILRPESGEEKRMY